MAGSVWLAELCDEPPGDSANGHDRWFGTLWEAARWSTSILIGVSYCLMLLAPRSTALTGPLQAEHHVGAARLASGAAMAILQLVLLVWLVRLREVAVAAKALPGFGFCHNPHHRNKAEKCALVVFSAFFPRERPNPV